MKITIISIKFLIAMTLITGLIYPFFVSGIAKVFFPYKSAGSFVSVNGKIIGSELISRNIESPLYFHPRPSAVNFLPMPSGASNLGPSSKKLKDLSDSLKKAYIKENFLSENTDVPLDAIFASGSGIDPHISPENAFLQLERVSINRKFHIEEKNKLIEIVKNNIEYPQFGILGEAVVNVMKLNIELDKLK